MKENIFKNGSKEKVPFDSNVINKAIDTSLYIEGKKAEILLSVYEKTAKLLDEIKNDAIKLDKHQKQVKDSKSKLDFLNVITDYIIIFLDNERMNTIGGEEEHKKIMNEACTNLQADLEEIQNMYSLLIKEINGKATKKNYKELYNIEYLNRIKDEERRFEKDIKKLNMIGTVIYPDYWRLEGMEKIYDTFKRILTETYNFNLSEYEPLEITFEVKQKVLDNQIDDMDSKKENNEEIINSETTQQKNNSIIEDTNNYGASKTNEIKLKIDINADKEDDDEEFHWDEDDGNDELRFDDNQNNENKDSDEDESDDEDCELADEPVEEIKSEEDEERDKEIDEILGIFDTDFQEEKDEHDIEDHILQIEDDDEELDDSVFENEKEDENKEKTKKRSLFGRRK